MLTKSALTKSSDGKLTRGDRRTHKEWGDELTRSGRVAHEERTHEEWRRKGSLRAIAKLTKSVLTRSGDGALTRSSR